MTSIKLLFVIDIAIVVVVLVLNGLEYDALNIVDVDVIAVVC